SGRARASGGLAAAPGRDAPRRVSSAPARSRLLERSQDRPRACPRERSGVALRAAQPDAAAPPMSDRLTPGRARVRVQSAAACPPPRVDPQQARDALL